MEQRHRTSENSNGASFYMLYVFPIIWFGGWQDQLHIMLATLGFPASTESINGRGEQSLDLGQFPSRIAENCCIGTNVVPAKFIVLTTASFGAGLSEALALTILTAVAWMGGVAVGRFGHPLAAVSQPFQSRHEEGRRSVCGCCGPLFHSRVESVMIHDTSMCHKSMWGPFALGHETRLVNLAYCMRTDGFTKRQRCVSVSSLIVQWFLQTLWH